MMNDEQRISRAQLYRERADALQAIGEAMMRTDYVLLSIERPQSWLHRAIVNDRLSFQAEYDGR